MATKNSIQFGYHPGTWALRGVIIFVLGMLISMFGALMMWAVWDSDENHSIENYALGIWFVIFGMRLNLIGILTIVVRKTMKIVMADQTIHTESWMGTKVICYKDIHKFTNGEDSIQLDIKKGCCCYSIQHGYFNSNQEQIAFMEELSKRIGGIQLSNGTL